MERPGRLVSAQSRAAVTDIQRTQLVTVLPVDMQRVLRNTYALLSLTLLFAAGMAGLSLLHLFGFASSD